MMPDPNSPTSAAPGASADADLLYAAAVRLLAADRMAELIGGSNARAHVMGLAYAYGLTLEDSVAILRLDVHAAQRAMVTGQVPA